MNKGNLNKLVTNYPVSLTNEEVENLSLTLSAVRTAGGGGGEGKTYTGVGFVSVNNTNNTISLTTEADEKLNQPIPTKVSDLTDSANYQTTAGMASYETTQHASQTYLTKSSADNDYAPLSTTADIVALKAVSGDFSLYYKKTETSSKEALETAFGGKQDNLTQEQLSAISSVSSIKGTILTGDSNILATSAEDGNNIKWTLQLTAQPTVTDTTLSGYDGIVATKDSTVSSQWNVGIAQAYKEQIEAVSSKLTQDDADTLYAPISVTGEVDTLKSSSGNWDKVSAKLDTSAFSTVSGNFLTEEDLEEYATKSDLETTSGKLLTTAQYKTDSATFLTAVPDTYALKSDIPTTVAQLTDSGNYYQKTETSSKNELSTEFAKYVTTALLDTVSSTLNDDIEYVSGQVDNKVDKPTEGNKIFVYQTTGATTSGWEEIPIEWDLSGRNFAIGVENEFLTTGGTEEILLQGYQNSGTYVDFAQGYQNSAYQYAISQGYQNKANYESMAQGYINTANNIALAQGSTNSADYQAFAQGILNKASYDSLAQGHSNSAVDQSIAQGLSNTAYHYSFAQGYDNKADMQSFAQGADNRASYYSQTIGHNLIASGFDEDNYYYGLFAIGGYNATTSNALFVVGNGSSYNGTVTRSDAFVIYKDGHVSAKGDIYANGVKLGPGGGTSYQGRNGVNVVDEYIELTTTAYNAITSVSSKVDKPNTSFVNNYLALRTDNAGNVSGWVDLKDNFYSKSEATGTFVATANIDTTTLSGDGKTVSTKLGVKTDVIATKDYVNSSFLPTSGGTVSGSVKFSVASGQNILAVASAATLIGASRQTTEHYGVDNTALGTTWVGVGGDGMHQGFIKYTDGGDVGALDSNSTIQLNLKPSTNKFDSIQVQINGGSVGYLIPAVTSTTTAGLTNDGILHIILES